MSDPKMTPEELLEHMEETRRAFPELLDYPEIDVASYDQAKAGLDEAIMHMKEGIRKMNE